MASGRGLKGALSPPQFPLFHYHRYRSVQRACLLSLSASTSSDSTRRLARLAAPTEAMHVVVMLLSIFNQDIFWFMGCVKIISRVRTKKPENRALRSDGARMSVYIYPLGKMMSHLTMPNFLKLRTPVIILWTLRILMRTRLGGGCGKRGDDVSFGMMNF